ncbi:MAG: C4-type zinc ribbon domain-containing protein, partial [Candidatus Delongbacteria bacterium]
VVELTSEIGLIDDEIKIINKNIAKIERKIRAEKKKRNELEKVNEKELEKLEKKKIKVEKAIRTPFLNHYNRIMKIRNGVAITHVTEDGLCGGCRIHIPYQLQQKIKLGDDYNICEGCGRILVDAEMLKIKKRS